MQKSIFTFGLLFFFALFVQCMNKPGNKIRYVAIGDSYTIGTGAHEHEAWPSVMTDNLQKAGIPIELIANPARNGWTTQDVIDRELDIYDKAEPNFATLLIGVNDWVQGVDSQTYHRNLNVIINSMQAKLPNKHNLLLVTIPDFSMAPAGEQYSRGRDISQGITDFNNIIKQEAVSRGLKVVDVFPLSKDMANDKTLVADDLLHPSAKEYALWEIIIYPVVYEMVKK